MCKFSAMCIYMIVLMFCSVSVFPLLCAWFLSQDSGIAEVMGVAQDFHWENIDAK